MVKLITIDDHRCLRITNDIQAISAPLFSYTSISYFNFVRVFPDYSRLSLSTRADWMEHYFANNLYNSSVFMFNTECLQTRYFFHHAHANNSVIQLAADTFNICYGFAIVKPSKHHIDFYHFATDRDKFEIYNFYLNNFDVLERFILYFDEKAEKLIKSVKPYVPETKIYTPSQNKLLLPKKNSELIKATRFKKITLDRESNLYLTYREAECLCLLLKGFTAKEIAKQVNLSSRTVEYYIQNIKKRFNLSSHASLLNKMGNYRTLLEKTIGCVFSQN